MLCEAKRKVFEAKIESKIWEIYRYGFRLELSKCHSQVYDVLIGLAHA